MLIDINRQLRDRAVVNFYAAADYERWFQKARRIGPHSSTLDDCRHLRVARCPMHDALGALTR